MNYYKFHMGDYAKATSHLTLLEHGVYTRLMAVYYTREEAIPASQAARLVGARSKDERDALAAVLSEFFILEDSAWVNKRCEEEIFFQRARAEKNRAVGKKGGRPPKEETQVVENNQEAITQTVSENNPNGFQKITQTVSENNPSHKPLAISHKPVDTLARDQTSPLGGRSPPPGTAAGKTCARLKSAGVVGVNPNHPKLLALLDAGLTVEEIASIGEEPTSIGKSMAWVLAAAEGRRRDAAIVAALPKARMSRQQSIDARNRTVAAQWAPPEMRQEAQA